MAAQMAAQIFQQVIQQQQLVLIQQQVQVRCKKHKRKTKNLIKL